MGEFGLYYEEFYATCFGASADTNGYFCMGVIGGDDDGKYFRHGAGYWNAADDSVEGNALEGTDNDGTMLMTMEKFAALSSWGEAGNLFVEDNVGASYEPDMICDDYYDEEIDCYLAGPDAVMAGSWYQPNSADSYDMNYRFSAGMEAWSVCV